MSLLQARQLKYQYSGQEPLFQDAVFDINPGDRIGLVGPNGGGKTTLLRILNDELDPDAGTVIRRRGLRVAYLRQNAAGLPGESLDGWLAEPGRDGLESVLRGLGFDATAFARPFDRLSAGERTRARLARCLAFGADLLLLDEPTNHLDLRAREWLAGHLRQQRSAYVVVSHDRHFLEMVTSRTFELRRGAFMEYGGGYDFYERERNMREAQAWAIYEAQQRRRAALERAAGRRAKLAGRVAQAPEGARHSKDFYARKAAKVARTGRLLREREQRAPEIEKPWEEEPIPALDFGSAHRSGALPVEVESLWKSYGGTHVLRDLTFRCRRGERWAIRGPNGSGKTTLFRLLLGLETPDRGEIRIGSNVRFGYYAQEAENLDRRRTPVELCADVCGDRTWIRTLLACLKLPRDLAEQPVGLLSMGECVKVALTRVLVSGANVLLLDEPTNHLEIEALEALEGTLRQFPGAMLFASHDRRFVDRVADHSLDL